MTFGELKAIEVDKFSEENKSIVRVLSQNVQDTISDLRAKVKAKLDTQGSLKSEKEYNDCKLKKVLAEQAEDEIKIRCAGLTERVSDNPSEMSDSKLLGVEKSLQTLDLEANKILEKVTYYTECVTDLDGCDCLSDMDKLLASTLDNKENGDEKLAHGLSELLNAMAEVSRLAGKYCLENELYYGGGLGKVIDLMGFARNRRFLEKNVRLNLSNKEKWGNIIQFLEFELKCVQEYVVDAISRKTLDSTQPFGKFNNSDKAVKLNKLEYTGKFGAISRGDLKSGFNNTSTEISDMTICLICDEKWLL